MLHCGMGGPGAGQVASMLYEEAMHDLASDTIETLRPGCGSARFWLTGSRPPSDWAAGKLLPPRCERTGG